MRRCIVQLLVVTFYVFSECNVYDYQSSICFTKLLSTISQGLTIKGVRLALRSSTSEQSEST